MIDHKSLRLSAILLFVGELLSIVAGLLHPSRENANVHSAVFAEYAESSDWTLVHLGQFVGMAIIIAGFIALLLGVESAVVALALYGMLQAVDGVALKQAVNAWVNAPDAEKTARFASAEAIRWLEWAIRSYQSFMLGLAFVLIAIMIVLTARIPSPIGYLIGLSGLAYIVQGFILGSEGFSPANSMPQLLAYILVIAWSIWLLSIALRAKVAAEAAS
jgi:hypothetical protein